MLIFFSPPSFLKIGLRSGQIFRFCIVCLLCMTQFLCLRVYFGRGERYSESLEAPSLEVPTTNNLRLLNSEITYIHFIGDLHGDIKCAKEWVMRTNLVNITSTPYQWIGNMETDAIVFIGDYVDKGPKSIDVIKLVRELQETFPSNVVAMLGNHDYTLLYDFALSPNHPQASPFPVYDTVRFNMHPEAFLNSGWSPRRSDDEEILVAYHKALQHIYNEEHRLVYACVPPLSKCKSYHVNLFTDFPPFKSEPYLADRARHRFMQWRQEYANGLAQSGMLKWLGSLPTVAIVGDALVAHGGVSPIVVQSALDHSKANNLTITEALNIVSNERFNSFWNQQAHTIRTAGYAITEPLPDNDAFELVDDLTEYRGYFDDDNEVGEQQCREIDQILNLFDGVNRVVIGHTPQLQTEEVCDGKLLLTDSTLSRFFRSYHSEFCPHDKKIRFLLNEENVTLIERCKHELAPKCKGTTSFMSRLSPSDPWRKNVRHVKMDREKIHSEHMAAVTN